MLTVTRGTSTFGYQYDASGNVTRRTYPDGTAVDRSYDPLGRMATVSDGTRSASYAYDVASNLVQTTSPPSGTGSGLPCSTPRSALQLLEVAGATRRSRAREGTWKT
jgi:YD repeat-containing protein